MDWKKIVSTVAPTLATILTGGNPLAGMAVKALSTALGLPDTSTEADLEQAILKADPSMLLKIKEAEQSFALEMKKADIDIYKIDAVDRDSARDREKTIGGWSNPILATVVVGGFFATVGYVLTDQSALTGATAGIVGTLIGYVSAKADQVISYYFGSSKGSKEKTKHMAEAIRSR